MGAISSGLPRTLTGWGRTASTVAKLVTPTSTDEIAEAVRTRSGRGVLARGLGRSYGDAAQNAGGLVLDLCGLDELHSVDPDTGVIDVDAGASLDALIRRLLPLGLFVPVTPGTRQVTVGGAIAADIHGKNHHVQGSFGNHVQSLDLLCADGTVRTIGPDREPELFWCTVGGMGLTGIVLRARIRMMPVETAYCVVDTERADNLDDLMARLAEDDHRYTYSVAWFDAVATGARLGRAVLTRGWNATRDQLPQRLRGAPLKFTAKERLSAPPVFPNGLLNRATIGVFNELWFRKAPRERRGEIQTISQFFHPLDALRDWNRVYGPRGFVQYQFVAPFGAEETLRRCVERISSSPHVSFLNVLKRFGDGNPAPLSFPAPGWTLAVDMPAAPGLGQLLDELDEWIADAGGRLYLAKDSRMTSAVLRRMYPRLDEWSRIRHSVDPDGVFTSDLSRRLTL
ncbi:oxidoreductase [Longimycelium tulufanense]|uniref:Oxidoreductase n=1 Tax=Longimycelium tulufanense TaxID=907463 RepID=A0A8J3FVJ2_9PSEU|nr:FAD-binding oxidoreductase [Longimycelium tulufanense]GGM68929.1 oxidoreductase [Longimycelium tulufanense]